MHSFRDRVSRRQMLGTLVTVPAFAAQRVNKMKFGFTTYQWGMKWDIPTLIANCTKAKAFGVELRTSSKYAHGVELELTAAQRADVKKRFAGSPVKLLGMACSERFDSPDPAKLKASIEAAKAYVKLSHDVGGAGLRVFPNDFHEEVPREKTLEQIAVSLRELGRYAADFGQMIRLENHGSAGRLADLRKVMDMVKLRNVRVKLNCDPKDAEDGAFERNFNLVKDHLGDTLHMREVSDKSFPYQLQCDLLIDAGWSGWWLPEMNAQGAPPDLVQALIDLHKQWDEMVATSLRRT